MAYTTNPKLPRLRMQAVLMVRRGASTHRAARYFGYNQSTVARWVKRADVGLLKGSENLPTRSSKPKFHPKQLSKEVVATIVAERLKHGRCSEVIYADLKERGVAVSLSSVKRTLARQELLKTKKYRGRTHINFACNFCGQPALARHPLGAFSLKLLLSLVDVFCPAINYFYPNTQTLTNLSEGEILLSQTTGLRFFGGVMPWWHGFCLPLTYSCLSRPYFKDLAHAAGIEIFLYFFM
jgi:transposase